MALVKRTYVDGETIITAQNLNDIQDEIISQANTFVPKTRTINSKALSSNITLSASDVGAAPTSHASTATTYGKGTSSNYGHVKISDSLTDTTTAATGGTVPSMKAVSDLNTAITSEATTRANMDSALESASTYVEDDFTASRNYVTGDFVYVKESNRVYVLLSDVSQGNTIGGHIGWVVEGTANNIKNKFVESSTTVNFVIQGTTYTLNCRKQGKIACISLSTATGKNYSADNTWVSVATLPEAYRPSEYQFLMISFNNTLVYLRIKPDGNVSIGGIPAENDVYLHFNLTYFL